MLKRALAIAMGWLALTAMETPVTGNRVRLDLAMWRLDCGDFTFTDYNAFFSNTSEYPSRSKALVGSCYLIRHGDQYMLWDTGIPAGVVAQPIFTAQLQATLRSSIVDQLARIGVRPEQVGIVGISHYHFDHIGQAAAFPHARLIMGAGDLAVLRGTEPGVEREPLAHWLTGGGQVTEARGDHDVFGDGTVTVLNLPGHTPGHRGLLVRLASGPVLLSGDTYHFAEQVTRRGVPPFNTNRADSLASMDRFDRLARNLNARVIIQHEPADVAKLPAFPGPGAVSGPLGGSFGVGLNPVLEASAIRGEPARVRLDGDMLVIEGAISGRLSIPAAEVARLRLDVHASRVRTFHGVRSYYSARIRRTGGGEIRLSPVAPPGAYGPVMRAFAQRVAEAGGLRRIEAGRNRIMAWVVYPACLLLLGWLTFVCARHAVKTGAIGDWLVAGMFAALLALFLPALFGIRIRPIADLKAIDGLLPPG